MIKELFGAMIKKPIGTAIKELSRIKSKKLFGTMSRDFLEP